MVYVGDIPGARGTGYKRAYIRFSGHATYIEKSIQKKRIENPLNSFPVTFLIFVH
ncbi:hypothetical protein CHK_0662 [Christensenella hongkongensis]|uniref:Uncharacterized protein n=1 Tax=Christensenella hongkongensis TaxID=270498 RepID=A0A0M2NH22_9FIRM|nr:hypothetical protein CHK_0662 [Christensenella hongkongensis]